MTAETEMFNALPKAFRIALLVTGSAEAAETAVLDGMAALEPDNISADRLLFETAKSATERHADFPGEFEEAFSILPLELLRVLLLASNLRHCFVLRVLLGMTPEICSGILHLAVHEVDDALRMAMQELPFVEGYGSARREIVRAAHDRKAGSVNAQEFVETRFPYVSQRSLILHDLE